MKRLVIDFERFENRQDVHEFLAQELSFPEYYGGNLDALFDVLSVFAEEIEFRLVCSGKGFEKGFLKVFQDAQEKNEKLSVFLEFF